MGLYIIKRFFMMVITIFIIATLTFFLMRSIPGSPFDEERTSNPTIQANLEKFYKLDQPVVRAICPLFEVDCLHSISGHPLRSRMSRSVHYWREGFRFRLNWGW